MNPFQFRNAEYAVDGTHLLGPLDLDISPSEITCVMGHNGAGKSLLLGLCHGTLSPTAGAVTIDDDPVQKSRRTRGVIFQDTVVMRRSVAQNIAFPLLVGGMTKTDRDTRTAELLEMVQLSDRADAPAAILSGGEAQRMALARALITSPKTILMDEPTSNLDPKANAEFEQIIHAINGQGIGFIWATHDRLQAMRMSQSVIFLENGLATEHSESDLFFRAPRSKAAAQYLVGTI